MRRKGLWPLIVFVAIALSALTYTFVVGNTPFLGLDLQGGVSVVLQPKGQVDTDALNQAKQIIDQRVNALGIAEPEITRQGNTILVQIPGVKDKDRAVQLVGQTAELRFRPVCLYVPAGAQTTASTVPSDSTSSSVAPDSTPAPADQAPADSSSTDSVTSSSQVGMGASGGGEGEFAAGAQPATAALTDQGTPDTSAATDTTPTTAPGTTAAAPAGCPTDQATLSTMLQGASTDMCANGVPPEQDQADQVVVLPQCDPKSNDLVALYVLGPTLLTGDSLETARANLGQSGQWVVNPVFKGGADGIDKFNQAAGLCFGKDPTCPSGQLAIVLDSRVVSAPSINEATFQRDQIQISGSFTEGTAKDLATVLKYGALPVELERQQVQIVSATLGRDALHAGLWAGFIGLTLVAAYMIAFYRILGVTAILKLGLEGALLWSIISYLGVHNGLALTLAGITGLIVSIGVSVDSNVVYFEHMKEDVRKGRTIRSATDKSFISAWSTIVKADVSSLIAAGLLWWLTLGPVRGFAFYLGLSTLLDLTASYFFMRPAVKLVTRSDLAARRPGLFGLPPQQADATEGTPSRRRPATAGSAPSNGGAVT